MPNYEITTPDGKKFRVTAPEGATQEQVLAYVQSQHKGEWTPKKRGMAELSMAAGEYNAANPAGSGTGLENAWAGVGKSVKDTALGLAQSAVQGGPTGALISWGLEKAGVPIRNPGLEAVDSAIASTDAQEEGLMRTRGGQLGNLGGQLAQISLPFSKTTAPAQLGKAAPFVGSAVRSALFEASQPVREGEIKAGNMAEAGAWGAGGQAVASTVGRIAQAAKKPITDSARRLLAEADSRGFKLGLGETSQNPLVRTIYSQLGRLPFSGQKGREEFNRRVFNQEVAKTFGERTDKITPEVYQRAQARLGKQFETLATRNSLLVSRGFVDDLTKLTKEAENLSQAGPAVKAWAEKILSQTGMAGRLPGKAYQSLDSNLGQAMKSGGEQAHYLGKLRELLRTQMDKSITQGDRKAWQQVRQQYASLKTIRDLVGKETGDGISPQALLARVGANSAGKERLAKGQAGELGQLAKIGQRYLRAAPDSGTADRALVNRLLIPGAAGAGGIYAQQNGYLSPEGAALLAAGLAANRSGLRVMNSRTARELLGHGRPLQGVAAAVKPLPRIAPLLATDD